jgi:hypothetical protein
MKRFKAQINIVIEVNDDMTENAVDNILVFDVLDMCVESTKRQSNMKFIMNSALVTSEYPKEKYALSDSDPALFEEYWRLNNIGPDRTQEENERLMELEPMFEGKPNGEKF